MAFLLQPYVATSSEYRDWTLTLNREMSGSSLLIKSYERLVRLNKLTHDPAQVEVLSRLQGVSDALSRNDSVSSSSSWLTRTFSVLRGTAPTPRGLYLYGSVGVGKTMLMDLFYENVCLERKRRVHFSQFMVEVHQRVHAERLSIPRNVLREENRTNLASLRTFRQDPISPVAALLSREARLLCFDEFQVTDIADAVILRGLFTGLFSRGVTVVATSNRAPEDLYRHGLQRSAFLPFLPVLRGHCEVYGMRSGRDYRGSSEGGSRTYFNLSEPGAAQEYEQLFARSVEREKTEVRPRKLVFLGRQLEVPESCESIARFSFSELCVGAHSAADYLQICQHYKTVFLSGVPRMGRKERDSARRFIILVDVLYDNRVCLVLSAAEELTELFDLSGWYGQSEDVSGSSMVTGEEERYAAKRTLSRLREMQSRRYRTEV